MARYFFDTHDGDEVRDEIGREIGDVQTLRRESLKVVTRRAADDAQDGKPCAVVLNVRDDRGQAVLTVNLVCQVLETATASAPRRSRASRHSRVTSSRTAFSSVAITFVRYRPKPISRTRVARLARTGHTFGEISPRPPRSGVRSRNDARLRDPQLP